MKEGQKLQLGKRNYRYDSTCTKGKEGDDHKVKIFLMNSNKNKFKEKKIKGASSCLPEEEENVLSERRSTIYFGKDVQYYTVQREDTLDYQHADEQSMKFHGNFYEMDWRIWLGNAELVSVVWL